VRPNTYVLFKDASFGRGNEEGHVFGYEDIIANAKEMKIQIHTPHIHN
jgi:hypothetical protein